VLRGGAFNNNPRNLRSAYRNNNHPANRNDNIGFRVVVSTFVIAGTVLRAPRLRERGDKRLDLVLAVP
jgi:hypothetical protein